jgi:hypothetical protein
MKIESLHDFGLKHHTDKNLAAFSPDVITVVVEDSAVGKSRHVTMVEMKFNVLPQPWPDSIDGTDWGAWRVSTG